MTESDYNPDRRPIASRERAVSKRLAHWLGTRGISPNAISILGMAAGVAGGLAFAATNTTQQPGWYFLAAAVLTQLRLLANMLDGMVATETGKASPVGELYNEIPDRVSDVAALIGAGYAVGGEPALGYVAACLALLIAYVRAEGKAAGAHQEFCGPLAKPQRAFLLTVVALYCAAAPGSWQPHVAALPDWGLVALGLCVMIAGEAVTAVRRLVRIARALRRPPP